MSKTQLDMFAALDPPRPADAGAVYPDPARIRRRLDAVLAEARAAEAMPWDEHDQLYHAEVFPRMSRVLPEEEGARYRLEFENEVRRLKRTQ